MCCTRKHSATDDYDMVNAFLFDCLAELLGDTFDIIGFEIAIITAGGANAN